jgi:hypothetical protein
MKKDIENKAIREDFSLDSRDSKRMNSVVDENEKFFEELATAYVNKEGEELKQDVLELPHLPTDRLDWKMKQALKGNAKGSREKRRRNRTIVLSTIAAAFAMFIVYNAVIPTMIQEDAMPAAEAPVEEAEPIPEMTVTVEDDDIAMDVAEPEEAPADMDEEAAVEDDVGDEPPAEPFEPSYFEGLFATTYDVWELEASLPEGYFVMEQNFLEDSTTLSLLSATNQPIMLTETVGEQLEREVQQNAEIIEVNDVQVFQNMLPEGEYQLQFVAMNSIFVIEGSDAGELIAVARAVIGIPELSGGYGMGDDISDEIEIIHLPGGLITIVPLP